jgi:hypothetical protein
LFARFDAARLIEMSENHSAKNRTARVRVSRQHRDTNGEFTYRFHSWVHSSAMVADACELQQLAIKICIFRKTGAKIRISG